MVIIGYVLVCLIFGTTFLAIKIGIDAYVPPFFSAGIRFFVAGLILFVWMAWKRKTKLSLLFRKEIFVTGSCLTFANFSALYWAEQYISSGIAAVISATGPLIMLILQSVVLRKKASAPSVTGCIIGFAGVMLLLLLLSFLTEHVSINALLTANAVGSFLYLTVIGSMIGHSLFYWLVAKTNPVFPSTWLYISPLIAVAIGVTFYREEIAWSMAIGGVMIIAGTILTNWNSLKPLVRKPQTLSAKPTS